MNVTDATGTAATYAVDAISDAIAKVSSQRSALGAVQNRLEHTIDNLDNVVENTTFLHRLDSLCLHRLISLLRVYFLCYSN